MCTMIVKQIELEGSGKGSSGWFPVKQANVSFDHPFNVALEHALNIDFVNEAQGPGRFHAHLHRHARPRPLSLVDEVDI